MTVLDLALGGRSQAIQSQQEPNLGMAQEGVGQGFWEQRGARKG